MGFSFFFPFIHRRRSLNTDRRRYSTGVFTRTCGQKEGKHRTRGEEVGFFLPGCVDDEQQPEENGSFPAFPGIDNAPKSFDSHHQRNEEEGATTPPVRPATLVARTRHRPPRAHPQRARDRCRLALVVIAIRGVRRRRSHRHQDRRSPRSV